MYERLCMPFWPRDGLLLLIPCHLITLNLVSGAQLNVSEDFFHLLRYVFSFRLSLSRLLFNVCCAFFSINVAQILHYMVTVAHYTHNHRVRFNNVCTAYTFEASHSSISKLFFFSRCSQLTLLLFLLLSSFSFQCVVVNSHIHFY